MTYFRIIKNNLHLIFLVLSIFLLLKIFKTDVHSSIRFLLILLNLAVLIISFLFQAMLAKKNIISKNIILLITSSFTWFLILELIFMNVPLVRGISWHNNIPNLANQLWFNKYWIINKDGFRDSEHERSESRPKIIFLGDSFTSGHGVKIDERFSNIISKTYPNYKIINLGKNGSDTKKQLDILKKYMKTNTNRNSLLVYQYYGNDISNVASKNGLKNSIYDIQKPYLYPIRILLSQSYLFNFIYWLVPKNQNNNYLDFLSNAYEDKLILNKHLEDINAINKYAEQNSLQTIAIIFPFMNDFELSKKLYVDRISSYFLEKKINFINVTNMKFDSNISKIVNNNDAHPSAYVHKKVSEVLSKKINTIFIN